MSTLNTLSLMLIVLMLGTGATLWFGLAAI